MNRHAYCAVLASLRPRRLLIHIFSFNQHALTIRYRSQFARSLGFEHEVDFPDDDEHKKRKKNKKKEVDVHTTPHCPCIWMDCA
jgi:hypothetical protein